VPPEHVLLGELVEMMGLTEAILVETADRFDPEAAAKIRKSTMQPHKAALWAKVAKGQTNDPKILAQIDAAKTEIEEVAKERNDFIHALFEGDYAAPGYMEPGYQENSAIRIKTGRRRAVSDSPAIRDRAAALSCQVAKPRQ
jgi:hypothetical protein